MAHVEHIFPTKMEVLRPSIHIQGILFLIYLHISQPLYSQTSTAIQSNRSQCITVCKAFPLYFRLLDYLYFILDVCQCLSSSSIGGGVFLSVLITDDGPPPSAAGQHRAVWVRAVERPTGEKQTLDLHNLTLCARG